MPSSYGGHSWHPIAISPQTGLVYIPAMELPTLYSDPAANAPPNTAWRNGRILAFRLDGKAILPEVQPVPAHLLLDLARSAQTGISRPVRGSPPIIAWRATGPAPATCCPTFPSPRRSRMPRGMGTSAQR